MPTIITLFNNNQKVVTSHLYNSLPFTRLTPLHLSLPPQCVMNMCFINPRQLILSYLGHTRPHPSLTQGCECCMHVVSMIRSMHATDPDPIPEPQLDPVVPPPDDPAWDMVDGFLNPEAEDEGDLVDAFANPEYIALWPQTPEIVDLRRP